MYKEGAFPAQWKRQKLVLLLKPQKPPGVHASYRHIYLLDPTGKTLQNLIYNKLLPVIDLVSDIWERQYEFRSGSENIELW